MLGPLSGVPAGTALPHPAPSRCQCTVLCLIFSEPLRAIISVYSVVHRELFLTGSLMSVGDKNLPMRSKGTCGCTCVQPGLRPHLLRDLVWVFLSPLPSLWEDTGEHPGVGAVARTLVLLQPHPCSSLASCPL